MQSKESTLRFTGVDPPVVLVGYSFEVHARRSEAYLSSPTDHATKIGAGDIDPLHFQYGKVGGALCAGEVISTAMLARVLARLAARI